MRNALPGTVVESPLANMSKMYQHSVQLETT
jgi:hypothetical protein